LRRKGGESPRLASCEQPRKKGREVMRRVIVFEIPGGVEVEEKKGGLFYRVGRGRGFLVFAGEELKQKRGAAG